VYVPVCSCPWSTRIRPAHMFGGASPRSPLRPPLTRSPSRSRISTTRGCTCHHCTFTQQEKALVHSCISARTANSALVDSDQLEWRERIGLTRDPVEPDLFLNLYTSTLKMEAECSSEVSVSTHKTARCQHKET
jgi:hypothetical protein